VKEGPLPGLGQQAERPMPVCRDPAQPVTDDAVAARTTPLNQWRPSSGRTGPFIFRLHVSCLLVTDVFSREDSMTASPTSPVRQTDEDRHVSQQLREVESRLLDRYARGDELNEDRVRRTFEAVRARFTDARVRTYVPILVERAVRAELGH
jgi:hypothetical protein